MCKGTYYRAMKGTSGHIYKPKTLRIAFPSLEEEKRFDGYVSKQGLKKGAFVYRLIKDYLDTEEKSSSHRRASL